MREGLQMSERVTAGSVHSQAVSSERGFEFRRGELEVIPLSRSAKVSKYTPVRTEPNVFRLEPSLDPSTRLFRQLPKRNLQSLLQDSRHRSSGVP